VTTLYLLDTSRLVVGRIDSSYAELTTIRRYQGISGLSMRIGRRTLYADQIAEGAFLYLPDGDEIYQVEQVGIVAEGSARDEEMEVLGRSIEGFALEERRVIPPSGEAYDEFSGPAESAMKHFVDMHAGPSAVAARRVPDLLIAADTAAGVAVSIAGRYQPLLTVLAEIGAVSGMGWQTTFNDTTRKFIFDTFEGLDLSDSVFFDFEFQTLEQWVELVSLIDSKTVAIVAGQGEGVDREVVTRWLGSEPTGFARRETFVDARDVKLGETAKLAQRGDATVTSLAPERSVTARAHQYGSFKYRVDWREGDIVLVRNVSRGLQYAARVIEVTRKWQQSAVAPVITAALGRAFPNLKDKVASTSNAGAPIVDYAIGGAVAIVLVVDSIGRLITFTAGAGGLVTA
jgi:hypothetical protein